MKLIIDISDKMYDFTKGAKTARFYPVETYVDMILNGTPLEDIEKQIAEKSFTGNDGLDYVEMLVVCKTLKGE